MDFFTDHRTSKQFWYENGSNGEFLEVTARVVKLVAQASGWLVVVGMSVPLPMVRMQVVV